MVRQRLDAAAGKASSSSPSSSSSSSRKVPAFFKTATTAQQIFFRLFLVQSAVFFFHVVVMTADDAAASPATANSNSNSNNNNKDNNDTHPFGSFYHHHYQQAHPHVISERSSSFLRSRASSFLRTNNFDDVSVYRDFTACSNDLLTLSCPTQDATVFLLSLFPLANDEAARDPNACVAPSTVPPTEPFSTSSTVDLSCQYFKNNVQSIRSRCKSTSSCSIQVADLFDYSSIGQRACTVIATFQCHPSPKMKNLPQYLRFCTNDVMRLTCVDKQDWLVITTAVYDFRPPGGDKTCSSVKRNVYCYAPQTQSVIRSHCERKRSCKLFINETTFGPIFGRASHQQGSATSGVSNSQQRQLSPITTAPAVLSGHDPAATAQCPSAENFALYVYFMCVPKVILSTHPRSSLVNAPGMSTPDYNRVQHPSSALTLMVGPVTPPLTSSEDNNNEASSSELAADEPTSSTAVYSPNQGRPASSNSNGNNKQLAFSKAAPSTPAAVRASTVGTPASNQRRFSSSTARPTSAPTSSTQSQAVSSSVIEQPSPVFRLFSDWIFALDYIQRNPYPVIATASLGVCVGLLLGAVVLLIRLSCRLRAARYHPPRRSVGLQCEMYAGRPAVLVRSTASQTANPSTSRPISGVQEPPPLPPQQQQRMIAAAATTLVTANGGSHHYGNNSHNHHNPQQQQTTMQTMAAMCSQSTVAPPSSGLLNSSLYAAPSAATAAMATRPLLVPQQQQQQQQQYSHNGTLSSTLGPSSSVASQAGSGAFQNAQGGPNRSYTYTPRLSVRWFQ